VDYWNSPKVPPASEQSDRCLWWVGRIQDDGWRRNRRISAMGYDEAAEWFGVYIWEYLHVLLPLMGHLEKTNGQT